MSRKRLQLDAVNQVVVRCVFQPNWAGPFNAQFHEVSPNRRASISPLFHSTFNHTRLQFGLTGGLEDCHKLIHAAWANSSRIIVNALTLRSIPSPSSAYDIFDPFVSRWWSTYSSTAFKLPSTFHETRPYSSLCRLLEEF